MPVCCRSQIPGGGVQSSDGVWVWGGVCIEQKWRSIMPVCPQGNLPPIKGYGALPYLFDLVCATCGYKSTADNK